MVLILGEDEIQNGVVMCRNMGAGTQQTVGMEELVGYLRNVLQVC